MFVCRRLIGVFFCLRFPMGHRVSDRLSFFSRSSVKCRVASFAVLSKTKETRWFIMMIPNAIECRACGCHSVGVPLHKVSSCQGSGQVGKGDSRRDGTVRLMIYLRIMRSESHILCCKHVPEPWFDSLLCVVLGHFFCLVWSTRAVIAAESRIE